MGILSLKPFKTLSIKESKSIPYSKSVVSGLYKPQSHTLAYPSFSNQVSVDVSKSQTTKSLLATFLNIIILLYSLYGLLYGFSLLLLSFLFALDLPIFFLEINLSLYSLDNSTASSINDKSFISS